MDRDKDQRDNSQEENYRKWQASRRRLLKLIGAAGATAVIAPFLPSFFRKVAAGADSPKVEKPQVRMRRWAMVIDLRQCDGCQGIDMPPRCTDACIQGHYAPEPILLLDVY